MNNSSPSELIRNLQVGKLEKWKCIYKNPMQKKLTLRKLHKMIVMSFRANPKPTESLLYDSEHDSIILNSRIYIFYRPLSL